jgi:hypothetical protein
MALADYISSSVYESRIIVEIDVADLETDWVNMGAGIWMTNFDNLYPYIDSTLIPSSFASNVVNFVGSVIVDGYHYTKDIGYSALTPEYWYYDLTNKNLYICMENYDHFLMHNIWVGFAHCYSFNDFTPEGATWPVEGRLMGVPSVTIRKDPLFFGKIAFNGGAIDLINADGEFDTFGQDNNIWGSEVRIKFGYADLDYDDYETLMVGYVENFSVDEEQASFTIADKRHQLTKPITYTCTSQNALETIRDILTTEFNIVYDTVYFDTTEWAAAEALAGDVTINIGDDDKQAAIEIIQGICASVFGQFLVKADGKYSFKYVDIDATAQTTIYSRDIRSKTAFVYDPTQVVSSVRIGYAKDWATTGNAYTFYTNVDWQTQVFKKYLMYKEQEILTYLETQADAIGVASDIAYYTREVHGRGTISVPMSYYELEIGDIVDVQIERATKAMIGTARSEIIGITYDLQSPGIEFEIQMVE